MKKLGFVGAGNMGQALAHGLVAQKVFKANQLIASDVDAVRRRKFSRRDLRLQRQERTTSRIHQQAVTASSATEQVARARRTCPFPDGRANTVLSLPNPLARPK